MSWVAAALGLWAVAAAPGVTITGTISWAQPQPCTPALVARDAHVCGAAGPVYRRCVEADALGRVAGALVYLEGPVSKKLKAQSLVIDQLNCAYVPRLRGMVSGSSVRFANSDPVLHNVRVLDAAGHTLANYAMPVKGQRTPPLVLARPGRYEVVCEAGHTWMNAHLFVFDHPYFAESGAAGAFRISGVPTGKYRLVVWHPDLGRIERDIVVAGSAAISLVLTGVLGSTP